MNEKAKRVRFIGKLGQGTWQMLSVGVFLVLICIFFSITAPNFNSLENYVNIFRQITVSALVAFGMNFVLLIGEIDLSVGSTIAVAGVFAAEVSAATKSVVMAVFAVLLSGALIGLANGFFITRFNIPSFIATLAMMSILRGATMVYTNAEPIFGLLPSLLKVGQGYAGPIPIPIIIMALVFIVATIALRQTKFGIHIYAVGGNSEVARLSGIPVKRVKIYVYIICGLLTALAGLVMTARTAAAVPMAGQGYELDAITAVVLGGTSMAGGSGSLIGTLLGVLVLGILATGLTMLNVNAFYVTIIKGIILLVAIIVASGK